MNKKTSVGIGVSVTALSVVLASCPLHFAIFGALGMTGVFTSPCLESMEPLFFAALLGFGATTLYCLVRLRRRRAATAAG